jgi:hypothetical protein
MNMKNPLVLTAGAFLSAWAASNFDVDYRAILWAVLALTVIGSFIGAVKWLVKHYLNELKPNSGSSMRDELNELRVRVDTILRILER